MTEHVAHSGAQAAETPLMTVMTNAFGLLRVMISTGVGADVAKRIAAFALRREHDHATTLAPAKGF